jgi:hypothetical protein
MWTDTQTKYAFGCVVVLVMGGLQGYAWFTGHNGAVFATTSAIIGGVAGAILGFKIAQTKN